MSIFSFMYSSVQLIYRLIYRLYFYFLSDFYFNIIILSHSRDNILLTARAAQEFSSISDVRCRARTKNCRMDLSMRQFLTLSVRLSEFAKQISQTSYARFFIVLQQPSLQ